VGFASGPYKRIYRALRRANRPPRPHHRGPSSAPDADAPKLVAGRGLRHRRRRRRWPERLVYLLIAIVVVSLVIRLGLMP
jgi:hypothetical protein